jgi:hypothetical protein
MCTPPLQICRHKAPILSLPSRRNIPKISLTLEERRARNRLRAERWRRAHGIGPRKTVPWPSTRIPASKKFPKISWAFDRLLMGFCGMIAVG